MRADEAPREEDVLLALEEALTSALTALAGDDEDAAVEAVRFADELCAAAPPLSRAPPPHLVALFEQTSALAARRLGALRDELARSGGGARAHRAYAAGASEGEGRRG
jgi:hypothetical protein